MDKDFFFEGGPYNGNSFIVPAGQDTYQIHSTTSTYSLTHTYERDGIRFIYKGTEKVMFSDA